ncbi:MAG: protein translocase subunit SecF, partial [Deltaproteobacteria bacterium]|nr:protein translocase subunit SecF [Deltaproteobacteria bacterium]
MQFIKPGININFIGKRNIAFVFSSLMIIATIVLLVWRGGPNYGVDFSGGVLVQVKMVQKISPLEIKKALSAVNLGNSIVQEFGEAGQFEYLIRIRKTEVELSSLGVRVEQALRATFGDSVEIRRVEMVGPKVGKDLRQKALFAIFYSILFIAIYISGRFEMKWLMSIIMAVCLAFAVYITSEIGISVTWLILIALIVTLTLCLFLNLKYALGAIIAIIHDVVITLGFFALTERELSLSIIAAFLTIVGYSLNDTIIVFDRIRENLRRFRRKPFEETMNQSINETLSR